MKFDSVVEDVLLYIENGEYENNSGQVVHSEAGDVRSAIFRVQYKEVSIGNCRDT